MSRFVPLCKMTQDIETWRIFKKEADTYCSLKNQSAVRSGRDLSFEERLKAWKANHSITMDAIERLCLSELLEFSRDNNLDASK